MLQKSMIIAAVLTGLSASGAAASCSHNGYSYAVGSVLCFPGGWLQECTVAGYWGAVGMCKEADGQTELITQVPRGDTVDDRVFTLQSGSAGN